MDLLPFTTRTALGVALCLAMAGCQDRTATTPTPAPAADTDATATPEAAAPAVEAELDGELVASTNEPFWRAQVSGPGPSLLLRGIEGERELAVASSQTTGGTRTVRAVDASGAVELTVTANSCQDSMSGAQFPYSAVLVIDGGTPINGCARPASMPPPGEPQ